MKAQLLISKRFLKSKAGSKRSSGSLVSIIAILGVMLGVMVPVVVLSVMEGFQSEIKSKILGVKGHVLISSRNHTYIKNYEQLVADVKKDSSVKSAVPYIEANGMVQLNNTYTPVVIQGVPKNVFQEDKELDKIFKLVQGKKQLSKRYEILVGEEMARKNLLQVGDRVSLLVAEEESITLNARPKVVKAELVGTFKTGFQEFDNNVVYMSLSTLQKIFRQSKKVKSINLKVNDIWDMDEMFIRLLTKYGSDFKFFSWKDLNYNFFKALALEKTLMYFIVSLILLVAVFNVTSSQLIIIIERKKEIGILKTIGMSPFQIAQIFLLQGFYITTIGAILGGALGLLISWDVGTTLTLVESIINLFGLLFHYILGVFSNRGVFVPLELFPKEIYYIDGIPSDVSFVRVWVFMIAAMVLSFFTGLLPSLKAALMKPIEVMRYE